MKNKTVIINLALLIIPFLSFGQAPVMGSIADFVFFTSSGAVANTSTSFITGDIGSQAGAISGFQNINGVTSSANGATAIGVTDLTTLVSDLTARATTNTLPLEFGGTTYTDGVYDVPGAGTITGTLTLDALGDANALFIFRIAGAFNPGANTEIILLNGALACNVFYITSGGAIACGANSNMKGNIIAQNSAVSMAAGCTLEGRLLSTTGAIAFSTGTANAPLSCGIPVLTGPAAPTLASAACYSLFSSNGNVINIGSSYLNGDIGTNLGITVGFTPLCVTGTIHTIPDASTATCATDVSNALSAVNALPVDIELLYPTTFGNNQVLTPHTYRMNAATTLTDTIFLNAQGNPAAVFVFQIMGAFTTATSSVVMLMNGALAENVYWEVNGALLMASGTMMKGTIIVNSANITISTRCLLEGRVFTTAGTVTVAEVSVAKATKCTPPITPYLGPAPAMASLADYVLFNSIGTITNTGTSFITGDVGSNSALIGGFSGNVNGTIHSGDGATVTGVTDLSNLYTGLSGTASTATHGAVMGNGETLNGQVYAISGTTTINGNLTLDGQGDASSVFIFQITDSLITGVNTEIILVNEAVACNVFWVTENHIIFNAGNNMKGTFIANNASITYAANGDIEGRLLSTNGAVNVDTIVASTPLGCGIADLVGPTAPDLASAECYGIFSSNGNVIDASGTTVVNGDVGTDVGTTSGFNNGLVTYEAHTVPDVSTATCATDVNAAYASLHALSADIELLYPALFGNKQVLTPHTYKLNSNTTLTDTLYFDAQGTSSAVFVIQINGTFNIDGTAVVMLLNGALAENIYWRITGATSSAAASNIKGTLITSDDINMANNCAIEGRLLSTIGIVTVDALTVSKITTCEAPFIPSTGPYASLGTASSFVFYTALGNVTNTGTSTITGDVGTASGSNVGFSSITGTFHVADDTTSKAQIDLDTAYTHLSGLTPTFAHGAIFGNGDTLTSGIYYHGAAASMSGDLYLDAKGDPNNFFVFQIHGALAAAAASKIYLINSARVCNVYWVTTNGAISFGAGSIAKGTFIANAAVSMLSGGDLEGGLYSLIGAVSFGPGIATHTPPCSVSTPLPVELIAFTAQCNSGDLELNWNTASEINNDYYTIEKSSDGENWQIISTIEGAGNSNTSMYYSYIDIDNYFENCYYRLKQTDFDGRFKYSPIINVKKCEEDFTKLSIYPNPAEEFLNISIPFPDEKIISISIYNLYGQMIYYSEMYQSHIVFEDKLDGVYFLQLKLDTKTIAKRFVVIH
jgi:hypothetical protein